MAGDDDFTVFLHGHGSQVKGCVWNGAAAELNHSAVGEELGEEELEVGAIRCADDVKGAVGIGGEAFEDIAGEFIGAETRAFDRIDIENPVSAQRAGVISEGRVDRAVEV